MNKKNALKPRLVELLLLLELYIWNSASISNAYWMLKITVAILSCVFNSRLSKQDCDRFSVYYFLQQWNMMDFAGFFFFLSDHDLEGPKSGKL